MAVMQRGGFGKDRADEVAITVDMPGGIQVKSDQKDPILELQLAMATSSINHEYARIEFDETEDRERREELLQFMEDCRDKYHGAREQLSAVSPLTLERFEKDLIYQKKTTLGQFNA